MKYFLLLLLSCMLGAISLAQPVAAGKDRKTRQIIVLGFSSSRVGPHLPRVARNIVERNFFEQHVFTILESDQRQDLLKLQQEQQAACVSEACARIIGKNLAADYVVLGSIDSIERITITLKVVSIKENRVIITDYAEVENEADVLKQVSTLSLQVIDKLLYPDHYRHEPVLKLELTSGYVVPSATFKDTARVCNGYSTGCILSLQHVAYTPFLLGLELNYIYLEGKDEPADHATLLPLCLRAGYSWSNGNWGLAPILAGGCSYNSLYYDKGGTTGKQHDWQPLLKIGVTLSYQLSSQFGLILRPAYARIFQDENNLDYSSVEFALEIGF